MNEQLKQIAIEAKVEHCISHVRLQEFAELFLEESIKVMMANDYHGEWLGEKLKEHFGFKK
jgi:hypothetical protein